jgi:hypothetical protein
MRPSDDRPVTPTPQPGAAYRFGYLCWMLAIFLCSAAIALILAGLCAHAAWVLMELGWRAIG